MARAVRHGDDRQRVLDATDIVQLVSEHVALRPKGREFVGLCPFHDDHSPSMCVVPHKQIYHCFSCGAGGNAITFVCEFHKMGFREALNHLAERANITLAPPASGGQDSEEGPSSKARVLSANQAALEFFRLMLTRPDIGAGARELLERRGVSAEMVELFGLGASPDLWDGLVKTVARKGLDVEAFVAAGLLKQRESGGVYDAFRNRLIFPIHDQIGRVVAFGGRRLSDAKRADGTEEAKYLNSAESAAFDKSSTLYGLHQAAAEIRRTRTAIVTEGYIDVIACHQAGVRNAVATLGTALTVGNARILRRLCEQVVLVFDGDEAGQRASERAVEVFFAEPIDVRIATLSTVSDAKDPDELLKRAEGAALFRKAVDQAVDPLTLLFGRMRRELDGKGLAATSRLAQEFLGRAVDLGLARVEPLRRHMIVRRLAEMTGIDGSVLFDDLSARTARVRPGSRPGVAETADERPELRAWNGGLSERLLGCVLCDGSLWFSLNSQDSEIFRPECFEGPLQRAVLEVVAALGAAGQTPSLPAVLASLEEPSEQRAAASIAAAVDRLADRKVPRLHELWNQWMVQARLERAYAARASDKGGVEPSGAVAPGSAKDDWARAVEELRHRKELFEQVGKDPRTLPVPR